MPSRTRRPAPGASPAPRRPREPPRRSRGRRFSGLILFLFGILVGAALYHAGCRGRDAGRTASAPAPEGKTEERGREEGRRRSGRSGRGEGSAGSTAPRAAEEGGGPAPAGRVALVIDDLGRSVADVDTLAQLKVPLSYAVLPFESETPQVLAELKRQGAEILCHLPMEPEGAGNPGPGALWYGMDGEELRRSTAAALAAVPGAVGVNNHMGSRLSADEPSMRAVLGVLAERRLFFLDSRTSAQSVGYRLAQDLGVPAAERQVFLDDDQSPEGIHRQFERLLALARERGEAIAIGHPHPATLEALAAEIPRAREQGFRFVRVSDLLEPRLAQARRAR